MAFDRIEYMKQWRRDNAEHRSQYNKQWREDNAEHVIQYNRQWYKDNRKRAIKRSRKWVRNNPKKVKAYNIAHRIKGRQKCSITGCNNIGEKHHPDYDKPLEIVWLCSKHHKEEHRNIKINNKIKIEGGKNCDKRNFLHSGETQKENKSN